MEDPTNTRLGASTFGDGCTALLANACGITTPKYAIDVIIIFLIYLETLIKPEFYTP